MYDAIRLAGNRLFDFHVADNNRFAAASVISTGRRSSPL